MNVNARLCEEKGQLIEIANRRLGYLQQLRKALADCKAAVQNGDLPPSARLELVRDISTPALKANYD